MVSELRRPRPHGGVVAWLESLDDSQVYLSAVTLGEIQAGIELTREQDPDKAKALEVWLELVAGAYNVLPMDAATFSAWARFMRWGWRFSIRLWLLCRRCRSPFARHHLANRLGAGRVNLHGIARPA